MRWIAPGIRDKTTIIVVSDHGFKTYHHLIHPNVLLRQKGLLRSRDDNDAWTVPEGGTAMVYVTREERRDAVMSVLREGIGWNAWRVAGDLAGFLREVRIPEGQRPRDACPIVVIASNNDYAFDGNFIGDAGNDGCPRGVDAGQSRIPE